MSCNEEDYTVTFDEQVKGWTSFHSYYPDYMMGINNQFFTFKGGNLHLNNSLVSNRSTYYGQSSPSKVSLMVNDEPSVIKELQAVSLEGNKPWDIKLKSYINDRKNFVASSLNDSEFEEKEGLWYAYARRNESDTHTNSKSTYGVGVFQSISSLTLIINGESSSLNTGDRLYNGVSSLEVGDITNHSYNPNTGLTTVTLASITNQPTVGDFMFGKKNPRVEGGNLRGYTMRMDLTVTSDDMVELFATNAEVMKSFT